VLTGAVLAACLVALPLLFLFLRASQTGWEKVWALVSSPHVALLLGNTVLLAATTTVLCAFIGVGAAWLVERTQLPGRRVWAVLLALPVALPDFVVGYGWVSLLPSFHGFHAAVVIMTSTLYPLVYLPVAASLRQFDPLLSEIGQSLGLNTAGNFLRVTLPQIRISILGGCLLVTLGILAEYGAFEIVRFQTFTTAIFTEFSLGFDTPGACAQSLVLVGLGLLVLIGEQRAGGRGRNIRSGPGVRRQLHRSALGKRKHVVLLALLLLVAVSMGMPFFSIAYWLLQGNSSTLPQADIFSSAVNTLAYSAGAAALATLLAIPVARFSLRNRSWPGIVLEKAAYLPQAIPGVVVGLSLVFFAINFMPIVYQTSFLLVGAYTILFFPLALVAVRASASQAPPKLEEAALSLGVRKISVFTRVTVPILLPGLAVSFALVFLSSSTELTATLLLHPTGSQTLATQFWRYTSQVSYGAAAPYAALIVAISLLPALLVGRRMEGWPRIDNP
jgi:iron(III) transport system permease protein